MLNLYRILISILFPLLFEKLYGCIHVIFDFKNVLFQDQNAHCQKSIFNLPAILIYR